MFASQCLQLVASTTLHNSNAINYSAKYSTNYNAN